MEWIILIAIVVLQVAEIIWGIYELRLLNKTTETQGKWILELCKKIEEYQFNEEKEEQDINKILSDMLNSPVGDNPYQE